MKLDDYIDDVVCACFGWVASDPHRATLSQHERDVVKAVLAFGNIYLMARDYAEDGDDDALAFLEAGSGVFRRVPNE